MGATCYMNANLQCFGHIERLTKYFLRFNKIEDISSNKTKYKLICEYIGITQKLWSNYDIKYYSPINFKNIMSERNLLFQVYKQMIQKI